MLASILALAASLGGGSEAAPVSMHGRRTADRWPPPSQHRHGAGRRPPALLTPVVISDAAGRGGGRRCRYRWLLPSLCLPTSATFPTPTPQTTPPHPLAPPMATLSRAQRLRLPLLRATGTADGSVGRLRLRGARSRCGSPSAAAAAAEGTAASPASLYARPSVGRRAYSPHPPPAMSPTPSAESGGRSATVRFGWAPASSPRPPPPWPRRCARVDGARRRSAHRAARRRGSALRRSGRDGSARAADERRPRRRRGDRWRRVHPPPRP